jgi:predicted Zn-dependent protease
VRPSSPVTGLLRARADWHQGHATEAIEALRAAVALDPMDCTLRVELARWYLEADERFGAQRLLAPLLRAQPDDPVLIELADRAKVDPDDRHKRSVDRIYNRP